MITIDGQTLTQIENIVAYKNGLALFDLDEVQSFKLSNGEESSDITGAGGVVLNTTKKNKSLTFDGVSGLMSGGLMGVQTGSTEVYSATTSINISDTIKIVPTTVTDGVLTDYEATGTAGSEIGYIYVTNVSTKVTTKFAQAAVADATHFSYNPATKKITLPTTGVVATDTVKCYYNSEMEGTTITNAADKYSGEVELVVNCMAKDGCGVESFGQFVIPRADFSGQFDIDLGSDQTVHNFSGKGLKNKCSTIQNLWEFKIYNTPTAG